MGFLHERDRRVDVFALEVTALEAERLGFNPNASAERSMITVKIGRIRDKTRWTKALGEAEDRCLWGL
jgi:hypothetical protein